MLSHAKACTTNFEKKKTVNMSYQLRGFMGPDSLVNIFSLRRIEKKKKKKLELLAISEKDFMRLENLMIMSILLEIHE